MLLYNYMTKNKKTQNNTKILYKPMTKMYK